MRIVQPEVHRHRQSTRAAEPSSWFPFDPDKIWGAKAFHLVGGTVRPARHVDRNRRVRGASPGWGPLGFHANPRWMGEAGVELGDEVVFDLEPEGPLREDLAEDIATSLAANPVAAAFFDTLAQFYRKAYLRYIDATVRRPEVRARRIAEVVELLAVGVKQRPRHRATGPSG